MNRALFYILIFLLYLIQIYPIKIKRNILFFFFFLGHWKGSVVCSRVWQYLPTYHWQYSCVIYLSEVYVTLELRHTLQIGVLNFPSLCHIVNLYHCHFYRWEKSILHESIIQTVNIRRQKRQMYMYSSRPTITWLMEIYFANVFQKWASKKLLIKKS